MQKQLLQKKALDPMLYIIVIIDYLQTPSLIDHKTVSQAVNPCYSNTLTQCINNDLMLLNYY